MKKVLLTLAIFIGMSGGMAYANDDDYNQAVDIFNSAKHEEQLIDTQLDYQCAQTLLLKDMCEQLAYNNRLLEEILKELKEQ